MVPMRLLAEWGGVPVMTVRDWVRAGLIAPVVTGGRGRGNASLFRPSAAVAVALGALYRREGADDFRVRGVVKFLAGTSMEEIERAVDDGLTMPVPASLMGVDWVPGLFVAPPLDDPDLTPAARAMMERLDLKPVLEDVKRKLAAIDAAGPARRAKRKR